MFDRFDILSAYYLFGMLYHGGQGTKEYAYTGRALNAGLQPATNFRYESLTENGQEIYNELVAKHEGSKHKSGKRQEECYPIHVWYKGADGQIVDYVRKKSIIDADYFLMRELRGRVHRSETNEKTVTYFGPDGLVGVAVDTRI